MERVVGEKIVVYPKKRKLKFISKKENNGYKDQVFLSTELWTGPTVFIYLGIEEKDGKYYEMFFQKDLPKKRLYYNEKVGKSKYKFELDSICSKLYKGRAEDGRKIIYARNINPLEIRGFNAKIKNKNKNYYSNDCLNYLYINFKKQEDSKNIAPEPVIYLKMKKQKRNEKTRLIGKLRKKKNIF